MAAAAQQHPRQDRLARRTGNGYLEGLATARELRCSTNRITDLVKTVLVVLHRAAA